MDTLNINITEDLLLHYCEGIVTEQEKTLVEEWILQSDENKQIAKQIYTIYLATDTMEVLNKVDTEKALDKVNNRLIGKKNVIWWEWVRRVAAVLLIPLLVAYCISYFKSEPQQVQMIEVKTNPGMTTSVVLPDNSVVILNSESSLIYPSFFEGETRNVTLKGEAYFSVTKDKKRKFIVNTLGNAQIKVYGTEFNVEAYPDDKMVNTTLVSGKVSFISNGKQEIIMRPGQKAVYNINKGSVSLGTAFVDGEIAWKDGKLIFKDTPFDQVLKCLSKRYNVDFVIKRGKLHDYSFTGVFEHQRLSRILEYFRISSNIKFKYVNESNRDINREKEKIEVY